jgi:hypothetical protein
LLVDELLAKAPDGQVQSLAHDDQMKYQILIEKKQQLYGQIYAIIRDGAKRSEQGGVLEKSELPIQKTQNRSLQS